MDAKKGRSEKLRPFYDVVERETGLEPATICLEGRVLGGRRLPQPCPSVCTRPATGQMSMKLLYAAVWELSMTEYSNLIIHGCLPCQGCFVHVYPQPL